MFQLRLEKAKRDQLAERDTDVRGWTPGRLWSLHMKRKAANNKRFWQHLRSGDYPWQQTADITINGEKSTLKSGLLFVRYHNSHIILKNVLWSALLLFDFVCFKNLNWKCFSRKFSTCDMHWYTIAQRTLAQVESLLEIYCYIIHQDVIDCESELWTVCSTRQSKTFSTNGQSWVISNVQYIIIWCVYTQARF